MNKNLNLSKSKILLFLSAIFLTNIAIQQDMVIIPSVGNFYDNFQNVPALVNFIVSGPQLIGVVSALLCGKLLKVFSRKKLLVFAFTLFTICSCAGVVAVNDVVFLAVMRAFVGAAMGIVNVVAISILADAYSNEEKRGSMIGIYNAAMALIGAAMSFVSGIFAANDWHTVFRVYFIAIPVLILIAFAVPKEIVPETKSEENTEKENMPWAKYIPFILSLFVFVAVYMVYNFLSSVYISETGIGNEALAGTYTSLGTLGSCCACLLFGLIYKLLKRKTIIPCFFLFGAGYTLLYLFPSVTVSGIASFFMGAAFGCGFSLFFVRATTIVPESQIPTSLSIVTAVQGLGMFASTYFASALKAILHTDSLLAIMPILLAISLIAAVLAIICVIFENRSAVRKSWS